MRDVRRQAHAFLATGNHDICIAQLDVLCPDGDRAQARTADLIDVPGCSLDGQPRVDMRLTRRVLPLARSQDLAKDGL